jgi:DNA mismatch endonuclease (patch repair protein)
MIKVFRANKITGWRRHQNVFGKPDFIFPELRVAIFVDGCFWHGCPKHSNTPVDNKDFWLKKLTSNKKRDKIVANTLREKGWRVLRIWEHELALKNSKSLLRRLKYNLRQTKI